MIIITIFIELTQKSMLENAIPKTIVSKIIIFMIKTFVIQIDLNLEHIIFNDIIIYDISKIIIQIVFVIDEFFEIWKNQGAIVKIFEKKQMFIFFKSNVAFKSFRVYFVNQKNKNVINKTFNKLYDQGKMQWIN